MNRHPLMFHNLLKGFEWVIFENKDMNSTLCYVNGQGVCYLILTPSGELRWHPDMYDKHYGRYGVSLGDFRIYIRSLVTSRFNRYVYDCKKRRNKTINLM